MIKITFDPRHDHLTAYTFDSNPNGVQGDMTWFDDTRSSTDYDAVWEVRTEITPEGWTAEFRIPFSQLRFSLTPGEAVVWGFNIRRDIVYSAGWRSFPLPACALRPTSRGSIVVWSVSVPQAG